MRYSKLVYSGTVEKDPDKIDKILVEKGFGWLIDCEIEMADIEIMNNTLVWWNGYFFSGRWHYGILRGGKFYGVFENGIIDGGKFFGTFISGIKMKEDGG